MDVTIPEIETVDQLIKRCSSGDRKSQEHLFRMYYGYVMAIAMRYSGNYEQASEITNDSFLKVFRKLEMHRCESSFKAWLRKIVINTALDYFRKEKKRDLQIPIDTVKDQANETNVLDQLHAEDIIKLLNQLPPIYRYTFNLYEIEGYSHDEIAAMLEVTSSTSRSNLTRAKKMLRDLIHQNLMS